MSGKSEKWLQGANPTTSTRTSAKTDGAFGKETVHPLVSEIERNQKSANSKRDKLRS
jgi:hypothetical protein